MRTELLSPSASGPERERGGVSVAADGTPSPNLRTDRDTMYAPVTDRFNPEPPSRPPVTAGTDEPEGVSSDAVAAVPAVRDTETAADYRDSVEHERMMRLRRWQEQR